MRTKDDESVELVFDTPDGIKGRTWRTAPRANARDVLDSSTYSQRSVL